MKKSKSTILTIGGLLLAILLIVFGFAETTVAAPEAQDTLAASEAVYADPGAATTNFDGGLIFISGNGIGGTSQVGLMKFNVSATSLTLIDKARLNMAVSSDLATCGFTSDPATVVNVYSVADDSWNETTLTFNTLPTRGSLLIGMDQATVPTPGHIHFSDNGGGALSTFLEAERAGDGVASLWIETTDGISQVVMEDNEGTGGTFGCAGADLVPTMQLADAASPTAVNLLDTSVNSGSSTLILVGVALLIATLGAMVIFRRRNAEV